eukprot:7387669-Ditylum_brightwellii.AAC.1
MRNNGNIPKTLFNELKFPEDTTSSGAVVSQRYDISHEWCQHCKMGKQHENENSKRESIAKKNHLSNDADEKIILKMKIYHC